MTAPDTGRGDVYAANCPTRQLLDRIADKWSALILLLLSHEDLRFNALKRRIEGVSQKMLSQTLRSLERDGLVSRSVEPTVPVTVTYAITPLGRGLVGALSGMIEWAETCMIEVSAAQRAYDLRQDSAR
ncbi:winged helix-turn-helix transcriptional regulator [Novosphingobium taihuense]|uniref:winged helix-turn-helix transcriptional regulator n=1 Tax=Novosphingobium taihuense TaxID=260085 RepID=UPI00119AC72D|nr:HxlR family transcriptional regulator [Novosphingobium taihuense]